MSNRDTIKALQARLASRLQAVQSQGSSLVWLAVKTRGHGFLLPLNQAGEIISCTNLQPIPHSKAWFSGVLNVRGSLHGVVDFAGFLADQLAKNGVSDQNGENVNLLNPFGGASAVTFNALLDINTALQIDTLSGLRGLDAFEAVSGVEEGGPRYFGGLYRDFQGDLWREINLRLLAQSPDFINISV
jgi:twitching motility protein PilI